MSGEVQIHGDNHGHPISPLPQDPEAARLEQRRRAGLAPLPAYRTLPGALVVGSAMMAMQLSFTWLAIILFVAGFGLLYFPNKRDFSSTGLQQNKVDDEVLADRGKKYLVTHSLVSLAPVAGGFLASVPLVATLPEWAALVSGAALIGVGFNFSIQRMRSLPAREARVRRRKLVAKDPLDGVTNERLDVLASSRNATIAQIMVTMGAFDGTQIQVFKLAHIMGVDIDTVYAGLKELEQVGLVRFNSLEFPRDISRWYAELTPACVRCLDRAGK